MRSLHRRQTPSAASHRRPTFAGRTTQSAGGACACIIGGVWPLEAVRRGGRVVGRCTSRWGRVGIAGRGTSDDPHRGGAGTGHTARMVPVIHSLM